MDRERAHSIEYTLDDDDSLLEQSRTMTYAKRTDTNVYHTTQDIDYLCRMTGKDRVGHLWNEVLYEGIPIPPFFDYDYKLKPKEKLTKSLESKHFMKCKFALRTFFLFFCPDFDFDKDVLYDCRHGVNSDGQFKISWHFLVRLEREGKGTYTQLEWMRFIMRDFHCLYSIFDTSVYSNEHKYCMPYGQKNPYDTRQMIPGDNREHKEHIVQYLPKNYTRRLKYVPSHCYEATVKGRKVIREFKEILDLKPYPIPEEMDYDFDKNDIEQLMKRLPNNQYFDDFLKYTSVAYALHECHELQQTSLTLDHLRVVFHKWSMSHANYERAAVDKVWNDCNHLKYNVGIGYIQKLLNVTYPGFWNKYNYCSSFTREYRNVNSAKYKVQWDEDYDEPEMRAYNTDRQITCIKGAPGSGKTKQLIEMLMTLEPNARICVLSYGVVLCEKYHSELKKLGVELYNLKPKGEIHSKRITICLDSLGRLQHNTHFDYVIIDEALSVFEHMNSSLMKDPARVTNVLQKVNVNSTHLFFIDANVDSLMVYDHVKWLERNKGVQSYWIRNRFVRETNREVRFVTGKYKPNDYVAHVCSELKKGKKIVCPVSSKAVAEQLYNNASALFPDLIIKKYDSESSRAELHADSMDPNTAWANVDLLIYTPTISAGVSFELLRFHKVIAYFCSSMDHAGVNTCYQQLFRVRQLIDGDMLIFISVQNYEKLVVDESKIDAFIKHKYRSVTYLYPNAASLSDVNSLGDYVLDTDKMSYSIIKNILLSQNRSLTFFKKILENSLENLKIPVSDVPFDSIIPTESMSFENVDIKDPNEELKANYINHFEDDTKNNQKLVLSDERLTEIDDTLRKGDQDVTRDDMVKRAITLNLQKWGANIMNINTIFFKSLVLSVNNNEQRAISSKLAQAYRYKRLNDSVDDDTRRIHYELGGLQKNTQDDQTMTIWRNLQKTGFQQIIACKKMISYVFEIPDKEYNVLKNPEITYKNNVWKPRLVEYVKGMKQPELLLTLKLFEIRDNVNSKGQVTSYKNIKEYSKTGSKLPFNIVKTMVNTTFGIQFVPADKKSCKSKFCNGYWSQFIEKQNSTNSISSILTRRFNHSSSDVEIDDDITVLTDQTIENQFQQANPVITYTDEESECELFAQAINESHQRDEPNECERKHKNKKMKQTLLT